MHPDLAEAVKTAKRLGYASITIDTNGYLFNDIIDKVTPNEIDFFSFSLDGPDAALNDPLRGKGSFDHCTAGIRKAVAKGFHTSLIYTVSSANIDQLEKMPPLLRDLGVNRFFIQVLGLRGNVAVKDNAMHQVPRDTWLKIIPAVAAKVARSGITVTYPKVYLDKDERFECAGQVADNYFIFPNGRVYRCPLCEDYPLHSLEMKADRPISREGITEAQLFTLSIPEGCVMNKLIQPQNLVYTQNGIPGLPDRLLHAQTRAPARKRQRTRKENRLNPTETAKPFEQLLKSAVHLRQTGPSARMSPANTGRCHPELFFKSP